MIVVLGVGAALLTAGRVQAQGWSCNKPKYSSCCPAPYGVVEQAPQTVPATPLPTTPKTGEEPAPTTAPSIEGMAAATPYDSGDLGAGALTTIDSAVGYIDNAIPGNLLRLRFDAAYGANRATRDEFFYARGGPLGPGLPLPEVNDDYQELSVYIEKLICPTFSAFIDLPVRFLNPTINSDHSGFGDLDVGFKWAFVSNATNVKTFQLRVFAPTGDASEGLGNNHVSVEPGLLCFYQPNCRLRLESELRLWVPIGGTNFEGEILRYGIGFSVGERRKDAWWINPVVEFVGWTSFDGREVSAISPKVVDQSASGDTIVNAKVGLRFGRGSFDVYAGYGRALTGEVWYKNMLRTELRWAY
jgi:hypothetical protein